MLCKANILQFAAASVALLLGLLVYLLSRSAESVYLFSAFSYIPAQHYDFLGTIDLWLPSLIHTYAFILLTVIAIGNYPQAIRISSFFWVASGWFFELGQHPTASLLFVKYIPDWFYGIPVLENSANYFMHGTFDHFDLIATFIGALAAWATYRLIENNGHDNEGNR